MNEIYQKIVDIIVDAKGIDPALNGEIPSTKGLL